MKSLIQNKYFKISTIAILLLLTGGLYLKSQATNFTWLQNSWLGGQSGSTAAHSTDANGTWTNYSAKDSDLNINGSGDAELKKASDWQETTDADFNSNTSKDSTLAVSANSIKLLKADGASCTAAGECQGGLCTGNICATPFNCGSPVTRDSITYGIVLAADGKCWLDRNLGATQVATAYNDTQAYGWLFQWGREVDGHQFPDSGTTTSVSSSDSPGHALFIKRTVNPYDWRNPQNNNLWQGVSGINNPCPTGFRLPTQSELATLASSEGITNYTTAFDSSLKFTTAGFRLVSNGSLSSQGDLGYYWSSSISSSLSYYLAIGAGGINPASTNNRGYGLAVRCIKD
jgi:uncharacterized protein (TIGR02145 family)